MYTNNLSNSMHFPAAKGMVDGTLSESVLCYPVTTPFGFVRLSRHGETSCDWLSVWCGHRISDINPLYRPHSIHLWKPNCSWAVPIDDLVSQLANFLIVYSPEQGEIATPGPTVAMQLVLEHSLSSLAYQRKVLWGIERRRKKILIHTRGLGRLIG